MSDRPQLSAEDLAGTTWIVEEVAGLPTLDEARPTLAFAAGGRVSGTTGANRFTGSYVLVGDELSFGPMATTRRVGSPEVMDQQRRLLAALSRPSHLRWEGSRLVLAHEAASTRLVRQPSGNTPGAATRAPATGSRLIVRGSVTYRERVAIPAQAALVVRLLDSSQGEPVVLAEQVVRQPRRVPVRFELALPTTAVDPDAWLSVDAQLFSGNELLWASEGSYPVLTRGASDLVQVTLRRVRRANR